MAYRMAPLPMTMTDPAGRFCCLIPFQLHTLRNISCINSLNQKTYKNKVDSSIVVSAINETHFADTIGMMFFAQVLSVLLVILCVIDVIFRIRSKVSGVTPWPAHYYYYY